MVKNLSKSQYARGLKCPKSLWFYRNRKELMAAPSAEQQAIFDQGTEFGVLAQQRFAGGVLIKADHAHPDEALEETRRAVLNGEHILYEAAFIHEGVLIRADIVEQKADGGWHLYEVKSTSKAKPEHMPDAAVQAWVMNGSGARVDRVFVVHANTEYTRRGALDLDKLFVLADVTDDVRVHIAAVPTYLKTLKEVADAPEAPEVAIGGHCDKPHPCEFKGQCWAHVPAYSVLNLAGARWDKKLPLWEAGFKTLPELPLDTKLTTAQSVQVKVARTGQTHIDAPAIAKLLRELVFPIHLLDFEAINPVVPPYDGTRPYQKIPFQASVHIIPGPTGGEFRHHEFLADGTTDPRPDVVAFLRRAIAPTGSVVAYYKSYEGSCLRELAAGGYEVAHDLLGMEARLWDLADPFSKALYVTPSMEGSWSIKDVLPALVPEMTYKGMAIADGLAAQKAYTRLMTERLTEVERATIMADLRAYCGQDTMGMVKILERLWAVTTAAAAK